MSKFFPLGIPMDVPIFKLSTAPRLVTDMTQTDCLTRLASFSGLAPKKFIRIRPACLHITPHPKEGENNMTNCCLSEGPTSREHHMIATTPRVLPESSFDANAFIKLALIATALVAFVDLTLALGLVGVALVVSYQLSRPQSQPSIHGEKDVYKYQDASLTNVTMCQLEQVGCPWRFFGLCSSILQSYRCSHTYLLLM